MKRWSRFLPIVVFAVLLAVFSTTVAGAEEELIVSAAASLNNAFTDVAKKFQSKNPGTRIVCNFAASGALLQQIDKGAPADVFASADQKTMDDAQAKKLIVTDTRRNFVSNGLVLIVPKGSTVPVKTAKDLSSPKVTKVSLGNPASVPAGRYAQESLKSEGLWDALSPKFILGESVRQVLDYVSRGEVDAGFVFATDAAIAKDKVVVIADMSNHKPILYPLAVIGSSQHKELAKRFIEFVTSSDGMQVFQQYGFGKP